MSSLKACMVTSKERGMYHCRACGKCTVKYLVSSTHIGHTGDAVKQCPHTSNTQVIISKVPVIDGAECCRFAGEMQVSIRY